MTICKDWLTFFAVVALLACNALFASTLKFSLDPKVIMPGEHARLEIRIPSQGLPSITDSPPVIHDELLTKADSLRIVEQSFNNRGNELVWTYDLTLTKLGKTTVPPVEIQLGSQSFSTEATLLELKSPRQQGDDNLRDDFGPVSPPMHWGPWIKLFALLFFLVGGGLALYRWFRSRLQRRPPPKPPAPEPGESALEWLQKRLKEIRVRLESSKDGEAGIDELTITIRHFFELVSRNPVEAWTTREFTSRFSKDEIAQRVSTVLSRCDAWKFGRQSDEPPRDIAFACLEETEKILLP